MSTQCGKRQLWQVRSLTGAVVLLAALSFMCARQTRQTDRAPTGAPEAGITPTDTAPAEAASPHQAPVASSNASCTQCHQNLKTELISTVHEKHAIFCTECHGKSTAHLEGINPRPAPDHTYADSEVVAMCTRCHHRHSSLAIKLTVSKWHGRKSPKGQPITTESVCTDCHGAHVLR